jgi:putative membrane protein
MHRQLAGTISGFAATLPMTAVMVALHKALPGADREPLPPRQITENAAVEAGVNHKLNEDDRTATTAVAHFGYGATVGAGYAAMAGKSGLHPAAEGALYGLAVWGGSYLGLMPATGLYKSATDEPAVRNAMMITAHIVWGAALGVVFHSLVSRDA